MPENEYLQSLVTELRRGSLTLAVLGSMDRPHYGYALLQILKDRNIDIEANTLYPLLRRLENQGLLASDWDVGESRPRKYYSLSDKGKYFYGELKIEWKKMSDSLNSIIGKDDINGE